MPPNIVDGSLELPHAKKQLTDASVALIDELKESGIPPSVEVHETTEPANNGWQFEWSDVKWSNVILITVFHAVALYGFVTAPYFYKMKLLLWTIAIGMCAAFGVTGGAHRFWTHKSYKAKLPMRIILAGCYLTAGMNSIHQWVRDHRVHHKYSETDADPHNSNRGFFFSHVGWLMLKKHPEVIKKGKLIDMSDIEADPVVVFCEKHFVLLKTLLCFVIPTAVPIYFWGEEFYWAFFFQISRYIYVLNATWSVNSFAHIWGNKPYDKHIAPVENKFVSYASLGEGWHNYHHVFPSDYRAAELGGGRFNLTTSLIDFFAGIGWVYDRRQPSENLLKMTIANRGDGTYVDPQEYDEKHEKYH